MTYGLVNVAVDLLEAARRSGVELRLVGSLAVLVLMQHDGLGRPHPPKDIDLAARQCDQPAVQAFLQTQGWTLAKAMLLLTELRETYMSEKDGSTLDVFYDEIDGNHPVSIKKRLGCSWPTLSWTDLLLTKLQRRVLRAEDVWDLTLLLSSLAQLDQPYFRTAMGTGWGFYTTATDNLEYLEQIAPQCRRQAGALREMAAAAPKSWAWRSRSLIGRRMKWWREVSVVHI